MTTIVNQQPYLRTTRSFPAENISLLAVEVNRSYQDTALAVNDRTIGIYPSTKSAITGNSWYFSPDKNQSIRRVYSFESTATIDHGLPIVDINQFVQAYGTFNDLTNSYGLLFSSSTAIAGHIGFYLSSTQIIFVVGAGAPSVTSGVIVLEYLEKPIKY